MEIVGYFILGLVAGVLSGLFGIGGGIVMVPALIVFFGMDILDANATSLTAMLLPVGALGVWAYYKAGKINIRDSLFIALGLFIGSFAGGEIAVNISESLLAKLYALILLYIALSYFDFFSLFKSKKQKRLSQKSQNERVIAGYDPQSPEYQTVDLGDSRLRENDKAFETASEVKNRNLLGFILVGMAAGVFAGLFGKGGGIVIVPLLIGVFRYDAKMAVATSLAALQLPVGLPSVIIYAREGHLNLISAAIIALGIVAGALLGSKLGIKLPAAVFKKIYAVFLLAVAVFMGVR